MCVCVCVWYLQFRGDGGVPGHGLGRQVVVAVGAVQERLPPMAVAREVGVEDQTRAGGGLGLQGAAAGGRAILHIEAGRKQSKKTQRWLLVTADMYFCVCAM